MPQRERGDTGAITMGAAALDGGMGGAAEAPAGGAKPADGGAPPPLTIILSPLVRANSESLRTAAGTPRGGGSPRAGEAEAVAGSPVFARGGSLRALAWGETSGNTSPADWGTPRSVASPEVPLIIPPPATADLDEDIHAIPRVCGGGGRSCEVAYALALFAIAIALALATVGLQITTVALGEAADPPSDTPNMPPSPERMM